MPAKGSSSCPGSPTVLLELREPDAARGLGAGSKRLPELGLPILRLESPSVRAAGSDLATTPWREEAVEWAAMNAVLWMRMMLMPRMEPGSQRGSLN